MIKLENVEVSGWKPAVRGMRNPMNSWHLIDSFIEQENENQLELGDKDLDLMQRLRKAGTDHCKYLRMITVYVDITAPLYWWKEFDTYKVGTVANSCSTMHKIHDKRFEREDFSIEHIHNFKEEHWMVTMDNVIASLNVAREKYLETSKYLENDMEHDEMLRLQKLKKSYWWQMIQLLPSSYNQRRTVMLNYEVLANIYKSRRGHKLDEWREFCEWVETLPYAKELITGGENE